MMESLESRFVLDSTMVFNELMYHPISESASIEWVELHNQMAVKMDLSGWRLTDGIDYTFPDGTIVDGGGYIVVTSNLNDLELPINSIDVVGPFVGRLSNAGERIALLDRNDREMDVLEYDDQGDWPVGPDGSGATLAKIRPQSTSTLAANWGVSSQLGGTPGAENFVVEKITRFSNDVLQMGDVAQVFVPRDASYSSDFLDVAYTPGTKGEDWLEGPTPIGFEAVGDVPSYEESILADGPVAYWRLGDVDAAEPAKNLGTIGTDADGVYDDGVDLGLESLINEPNDTAIGLALGRFDTAVLTSDFEKFANGSGRAIEFWVQLDRDASATASLVGDGDAASDYGHMVYVTSDNRIRTFFRTTRGATQVDSVEPIAVGEVVHVVSAWDAASGEISLLFNGEQAATTVVSGSNPLLGVPANTDNPIFIGGDDRTILSVNARVDEVAIYNKPIDVDMATRHFKAGQLTLGKRLATSVESEMFNRNASAYVRFPFELPNHIEFDQLSLDINYDDGFVAYLNAEEIARRNAPVEVTFQSAATVDRSLAEVVVSESIDLSAGIRWLSGGENLLAIQLLNSGIDDVDSLISVDLQVGGNSVPAPPPPKLSITEVAAASQEDFQIELRNDGDQAMRTGGFVLSVGGGSPREAIVPDQLLEPNEYLVLDEALLGFDVAAGERLFLYRPGKSGLADAVLVTERLRGISEEQGGEMLYPSIATFGAANQFGFLNSVVINEIMYHHRPDFPTPDVEGQFETREFLPMETVWKYNATGVDLGVDWFKTEYSVDENGWQEGVAPIGYETSAIPIPMGTQFPEIDSSIIRYYYQTEFDFDVAPDSQLVLQHYVDDGAIFYLNGVELLDANAESIRFNMRGGEVFNTTIASPGVSNAKLSEPIVLSSDELVQGRNVLSVEVHQSSTISNDTVFGVVLSLRETVSPFLPGMPYRENDEEWIELYNRGDQIVDLTGWTLDGGVRFDFADGTTMGPGEYILIARDEMRMAEQYEGIRIVGEYAGALANSNDRIILRDRIGNPADDVSYFDDGQWSWSADGGGSSLELIHPDANNGVASAWAASVESARSEWQTYTYGGIAQRSAVGADSQWREFIFGMLDAGEVLIDDVQVTDVETGDQLIANQDFTSMDDTTWRFRGNHRRSEIIEDPDDPTNRVLRLVATGPTEHMHNQVETDLLSAIQNGRDYEISYRAKWITGAPMLHSRLYFNRLAQATALSLPDKSGTPGMPNSRLLANAGPTLSRLDHSPAVPEPMQPIRVSIQAEDHNGIASVMLWYAIDRQDWQGVLMSNHGNEYAAELSGLPAGTIVQFYVEATDQSGAHSWFPRRGPESGALFQVGHGEASNTGIHNMRIIVTPDNADWMHADINLMSNDRVPTTVIYNENETYYDVGVRLSGSQRARPFQPRLSFSVRFNQEQLFRGVHQSVTLDRSDSTGYGQREIILNQATGRAGGIPAEYNDLVHIITPRSEHTGGAELQLARYTNVYLDSQYENGSDGGLFEYELVYYPTTRNADGFKLPRPDSVIGTAIRDLGDSKEDYRWTFLNKSKRAEDDYAKIIEWAQVMGLSGDVFAERLADVIDVDQWLRAGAFAAMTGFGDNYGDGSQHNAQFYVRPSDGRVLFFPHDLDAFFDANRGILPANELSKIVRATSANTHHYYGHMYDMVTRAYNGEYLEEFVNDYRELLPGQSWNRWLTDVRARANVVRDRIEHAVPRTEFTQTSPTFVEVGDSLSITMTGTAWVDVREFRHVASNLPLEVRWDTPTTWSVQVPLDVNTSVVSIAAYDFQGEWVGEATAVPDLVATNRLDNFRLTEVNYNPAAPTSVELALMPDLDNDDFEFVEFHNVGEDLINLLGVQFVDGVSFAFDNLTFASGEHGVVVRNEDAFRLRYGDMPRVLGEFSSGGLRNSGERLTIMSPFGQTLVDFSYDDTHPWPEFSDGNGATLQIVDEGGIHPSEYRKFTSWRSSVEYGGSPGIVGATSSGVVVNEIYAHPEVGQFQVPVLDAVELLNTTDQSIDMSGWFLSDSVESPVTYRVADGTTIGAGEFHVLDANSFSPALHAFEPSDFAIGSSGGDITLVSADEFGQIRQFIAEAHYGASAPGTTLGRSEFTREQLVTMSRPTMGCQNSSPAIGSVVISEVNFRQRESPSGLALEIDPQITSEDLEYVELYNAGVAEADLAGWRMRGEVDHDFREGTLVPPGGVLVVLPFNPWQNPSRLSAFKAHYGLGNAIAFAGAYEGSLDDVSGRMTLQFPHAIGIADSTKSQRIAAEELFYDWTEPELTLGERSLTRISFAGVAADTRSWRKGESTPGKVEFDLLSPGDLNQDSVVSAADIDLLLDGLRTGAVSSLFDINNDSLVSAEDLSFLVTELLETSLGDANLDKRVDAADLNLLGMNWLRRPCRGWAGGDLNGDGKVDAIDLNVIGKNWVRSVPRAKGMRVPRAAIPAFPVDDVSLIDEYFAEEVRDASD